MAAIKQTLHITTQTTGDLIEQISIGLLKVLSGVATGISDAVEKVGDIANEFGEDVKVVSHTVSLGAGNLTKEIAGCLGSVVKVVPVVGAPTAYVVKGAGTGIYYVVMSVADVIGTVSTVAGKTVKTTSKAVVFTITSGKDIAGDAVSKANTLVKTVLGRVHKMVGNKHHNGKMMSRKSSKSGRKTKKNNYKKKNNSSKSRKH